MSDYVKIVREVEKFLRECEDDGLLLDIWNDFCDESDRIYNIDCEFNEVMESDFSPSEMWEIFTNSSNFSVNDTYFRVVDCCTEIQSSDDVLNLIDNEEIENLSNYIVQNKKDYGWNELKVILNPYGFKSDHDGLYYQTEKRKYNLYEGKTIKGDTEKTSDIIFIMDDENVEKDAKIVNFIYGATMINDELKEMIAKMIKEYEEREGKNL